MRCMGYKAVKLIPKQDVAARTLSDIPANDEGHTLVASGASESVRAAGVPVEEPPRLGRMPSPAKRQELLLRVGEPEDG